MDTTEMCSVCGTVGALGELAAWFVNSERRTVHTDCWIALRNAYERSEPEEAAA